MTTILGVRFDGVTMEEALRRAAAFLADGERGRYVVTPNPEMLVAAHRDAAFRDVLNGSALSLADGFGIRVGAALAGQPVPPRVTGTDFLDGLCGVAASSGASVYFLGAGREDAATEAAATLSRRHPGLRVVGAEPGGESGPAAEISASAPESLERIRAAAPDILVVPFGHGAQERFLASRLGELPSVKIGVGVGGALDFWSGRVRRAPSLLRRFGLEWAWRLAMQPKRWRRIFTAVVAFPWLVIKDRLR